MADTSMNLVDTVKAYMTGDFGNRASSLLGESKDRTHLAIAAAIPAILALFDKTASTAEGARTLSSVVDSTDDGILSNIGSLFGRSADLGTGTLRTLFGGGALSDLSDNTARVSGLPAKSVTTLLGILAPIALAVLRRLKQSRQLDAFGLANLLAGQRANITAAMPEGMRESYREPIREATEETYRTARPTPVRTTETYSAKSSEPEKSSLGWILPLALLAGLLGLIWYWSTRPAVRAGREESSVSERVARLKGGDATGRMASLEALKAKYDPAIRYAREHGVMISSLTARDGKLFIRGTAPSTEAVNGFNDQIRRINPNMDDVVVDLSVASAQAPAASSTEPVTKTTDDMISRSKPMAAGGETYIVKRGDTLVKISRHFYGTSKEYVRILNANKGELKNQNILRVGQKLEIPAK
jgi:LysM repeat protein